MALTLTTPNTLVFAGNPIVVRCTTTKSLGTDESMLRIVLSATFEEKYSGGGTRSAYTYTTDLSQPVEDAGTAVFNLSDSSQTIINRLLSELDMNSDTALSPVGLTCTYTCTELWVKDGYEVTGESTAVQTIYIVPGRFTDYEMLAKDSIDLAAIADTPRIMSRKPDLGIVYSGETIVTPLMGYNEYTIYYSLSVGGTASATGNKLYSDERTTDYHTLTPTATDDADITLTYRDIGSRTGYFRTVTRGVHFLRFVNGFGAVENISVRVADKLTYETEGGETHSLVQQSTVRPTDRRYASRPQPVGVYELSSGYVPRRWAEWYVQELLTTPKAWMLIDGIWVPGVIEADDDCVIYDRSKPEMPHVDFKFRLAVDGVTGCVWE